MISAADKVLARQIRKSRGIPARGVPTAKRMIFFASVINERFWDKVQVGDPDKCWPWTGARDDDGYGNFTVGPYTVKAHVCAYILWNRRMPKPKYVVDHKCENRICSNPHCLQELTKRENTLKGNGPTARNRRAKLARLGT